MSDKSVIEEIADSIKESTEQIHKSNKKKFDEQKKSFKERHAEATAPQPGIKAKYEQEKAAFSERHAEATTPDLGLEKVKQANGIGGIAKAIVENIVAGAKENTEMEKQRQAEITGKANPKS